MFTSASFTCIGVSALPTLLNLAKDSKPKRAISVSAISRPTEDQDFFNECAQLEAYRIGITSSSLVPRKEYLGPAAIEPARHPNRTRPLHAERNKRIFSAPSAFDYNEQAPMEDRALQNMEDWDDDFDADIELSVPAYVEAVQGILVMDIKHVRMFDAEIKGLQFNAELKALYQACSNIERDLDQQIKVLIDFAECKNNADLITRTHLEVLQQILATDVASKLEFQNTMIPELLNCIGPLKQRLIATQGY
jgi:hypothetical protein